jgi:alpha-glucosidase
VLVLARDLNALVNTDFISNLNPPPGPEFSNADWIKPGRSTWQWWCSGGPKLNEQGQWLDWTRATGFDYYLIDEGWKNWKQGDLKDWALLQQVADEAKAKNVKLWIWLHSREVATHSALVEFMDKVAALGVVGVKIDFIPRCSRNWSNWYVDVLREAAKRKLMVDFHGATKPTGMERTWPNEVSRESVRGHEWHISRYNRVLPPSHDTVLPFTRYVIGHGDYTPTVFNPAELKGYTWPRELAQAIVFTSPYLCYADHPKNYLANPAFDVMKEIPSTWDETRVLPGSAIGECAAFARRKGKDWFIGVINGGQPKTLKVALDFLGTETYRATLLAEDSTKDDAFARTEKNLTAKETLTLSMRGSSGFVARLKVTNPGP